MDVKGIASAEEWAKRPARGPRTTPESQSIVRALAKARRDEWVVVELTNAEKKRQPTIRGRITAAAANKEMMVEFEMRAGDLGIRRVS